jgi:very-short-patch-repair endonuclease
MDVCFRRQQPIGPHIADFCCLPLKLIVELGGNQHRLSKTTAYDNARTRWLEAQGFAVLRFQNSEALKEMQRVLDVILNTITQLRNDPSPKNAPHFSTLPQGERSS